MQLVTKMKIWDACQGITGVIRGGKRVTSLMNGPLRIVLEKATDILSLCLYIYFINNRYFCILVAAFLLIKKNEKASRLNR